MRKTSLPVWCLYDTYTVQIPTDIEAIVFLREEAIPTLSAQQKPLNKMSKSEIAWRMLRESDVSGFENFNNKPTECGTEENKECFWVDKNQVSYNYAYEEFVLYFSFVQTLSHSVVECTHINWNRNWEFGCEWESQ